MEAGPCRVGLCLFMRDEYLVRIRPARLAVTLLVALTAAVLVGTAVYAFRGPLSEWLIQRLVDVDRPVRSDAIVVLSGETPEREIAAADLYHDGYASQILMTEEPERSGVVLLRARGIQVPRTIDARREYLRQLGVPAGAITVLDPQIVSTINEAERVAAWVRSRRDVKLLLAVTSPTHTKRARYSFERVLEGTGVSVRMHATAFLYDPGARWQARVDLREALIEWQKIVFYRLRYCCT